MHTAANHPVQVKGGPEGVGPGQEGGVFVAHVDGEGRLDAQNVRQRVPVGEHNTLGVTRGTGGVDEGVQCKRVVGHFEHVGLAASGHEFSPCVNGYALWRKLVGGLIAQQQDPAGRPTAGFAWHVGHELVEHSRVGNGEESGGGIVEDVGPFRAVLMCVHGGVGCTDTVGTVGKSSPFHRVVEDQRNTIAGVDANGSKLFAHGRGKVAKLVVRKMGSWHAGFWNVSKTVEVAEALNAGHQHLVQGPGVVAFWLLPLSVVGLAFPCKFKGFHGDTLCERAFEHHPVS